MEWDGMGDVLLIEVETSLEKTKNVDSVYRFCKLADGIRKTNTM